MTSAVPTTQPRKFGTLKAVQPPAGLSINEEVMLCHMIVQGEVATVRLQATADPATREWLQAGVAAGRRARNRLVEWHLPLVKQIAHQYRSSAEAVDLEQEGYLALVEAAMQHDYAAGQRFCVTAAYAVRQAVRQALRRSSQIVLPAQVQLDLKRLYAATAAFSQQQGRNPDSAEVAAMLGLSSAKVASLQSIAEGRRILSLDLPTGSEAEGATLGELLPAEEQEQPPSEEQVAVLQAAVRDLLTDLPADERKLVSLYHGLDGEQPHTYKEIGLLVGVSRETIRNRIHKTEAGLRDKECPKLPPSEEAAADEAEVTLADELRIAKRKAARCKARLAEAQLLAEVANTKAEAARQIAAQYTNWARAYEQAQPQGRDRELRWQQAGYYTAQARQAEAEAEAATRLLAVAKTKLVQAETALKRLAASIKQQYQCQCGRLGCNPVRLYAEWQPQNEVLTVPTRWFCNQCVSTPQHALFQAVNHVALKAIHNQTGDITTRIYVAELKQWLPAQVYGRLPERSKPAPISTKLACYRCTHVLPRELAVDVVVQPQDASRYRLVAICPPCYRQVGGVWQQRKETTGTIGIFDRYPAAPERKAGKRFWIKTHGYHPAEEQASLIRVSRQQRAEWRKAEAEWLLAQLDPYQRRLVMAERQKESKQQQQQREAVQLQQAQAHQQAVTFWPSVLKYPALLTRLVLANWLHQMAAQPVAETPNCPTCGSYAGRRYELDEQLTMLICTFCERISVMQRQVQPAAKPTQPAAMLNCGRCHKAMAAGSRVLVWRPQQQCWLVRCARCAIDYAAYRQKMNEQTTSNKATQPPKPEAQPKVAVKRPAKRNPQRQAAR